MNFWAGRRVLVTGGGGYLARVLIRELAAHSAEVVAVDLQPLASGDGMVTVCGDLTDVQFVGNVLGEFRIQTCFHLAGHAGVAFCDSHPFEAFEANARTVWSLLEACRTAKGVAEIVVTSSNHVYGDQTLVPTPEDVPLRPVGAYAVSKACGDFAARAFARSHGLSIGIARITNTFGGRDPHTDHLITGTILAVLSGRRPVIRGNGTATKGYLYIADTIDAMIRFAEVLRAEGLGGEALNVAPDVPVSVRDIVARILRLAGAEGLVPVVEGDPAVEEEFQHLSNAKARRLLGWQPRYSLEEGLRLAIADLQTNDAMTRGLSR